ncbi:MAG: ABC transporter ATP-binding protein [Candidatus Hydrothermarchaeales archaeon]
MLRVENLCKSYDGKEVLKGIDFEVEKGEIFTIIGPSGSGKTTLLRLLDLLDQPTKGRIFFDGVDITGRHNLELRRRMAMVFQGAPIFNMSVYDNVAYGLRLRKERKEEIDGKVENALELVGLMGYEDRNAKTLSGGEAQRVAFAMATVFQPELLLLDEPTANLDPINEALVEEIIRRIKNLGITVVLATHKQAEAMGLADHVAVLNEGMIEQFGEPKDIFHRPRTLFVARFVGARNILQGKVEHSDASDDKTIIAIEDFKVETPYRAVEKGASVYFCIRPEEVMLLREDRPITPRHTNILQGRILDIHPFGSAMLRLNVRVKDLDFVVDIPRHVLEKMELNTGKEVRISLKASSCNILE